MGLSESTLKITEATIRADAERFSCLHSWYKHLPQEGTPFLITFERGKQEPHPRDPVTEDLHMHLYQQNYLTDELRHSLPFESIRRPVILNGGLYGNRYMAPECCGDETPREKMLNNIVSTAKNIAKKLGVFQE
jgi:hypothetical protein